MAPYTRGDVVWHPAPFRDGGRPYVVVSGDDHPFHGEEYLVAGVTTTEREGAVSLPPEAWAAGGAPEPSWVSPWYVLTVKHATIDERLGRLTPDATDAIAEAIARLVGVEVGSP
jgi:mRNA-degrading endonuclease toxin of MazEF toxin-antitoxin module